MRFLLAFVWMFIYAILSVPLVALAFANYCSKSGCLPWQVKISSSTTEDQE